MDLLAQYTDSDDSRPSSPEPQPVIQAEEIVQPAVLLPPPDLSSVPTVPAVKRPHVLTSGTGPLQGPAKVAKFGPAPKRTTQTAKLLPPQLRGRSNVVTEDLEKMFGKRLDARKKQAAPEHSGASSAQQEGTAAAALDGIGQDDGSHAAAC